MDCVMLLSLVWMFVSLGYSLTITQPRMVLVNPNQTRSPKTLYKPVEICFKSSFGMTGLKIPICKTIVNFSLTKPPIIRCRVGKINTETADKLRDAYSGIFQHVMHSPSRGQPEHDGDICCPTTRALRKASSWMLNAYGVYRDVLLIPEWDMNQYYHSGSCLNSSELIHCQGTCMPEKSIVYLMTIREDIPMKSAFEPFEVPSYCSCKNLGKDRQREGVTSQKEDQSPRAVKPTSRLEAITTMKPDSYTTRSKTAKTYIPGDRIRVRYGQVMHKSRFTRPTRAPQRRFPNTQRNPTQSTTSKTTSKPTIRPTHNPTEKTTPKPTMADTPAGEDVYPMMVSNVTLDSSGGVNASPEINATLASNETIS